jgi:hypothetical protein
VRSQRVEVRREERGRGCTKSGFGWGGPGGGGRAGGGGPPPNPPPPPPPPPSPVLVRIQQIRSCFSLPRLEIHRRLETRTIRLLPSPRTVITTPHLSSCNRHNDTASLPLPNHKVIPRRLLRSLSFGGVSPWLVAHGFIQPNKLLRKYGRWLGNNRSTWLHIALNTLMVSPAFLL